jgi:AbrB family looped-hinge helix DNA binding protein
VRVTSKGQVTIPQEIRERFGLLPDTEVEFVARGKRLEIVRSAEPARRRRGRAMVDRARGTAKVRMTTDQILALTRRK